jgi:putative lipoprotein
MFGAGCRFASVFAALAAFLFADLPACARQSSGSSAPPTQQTPPQPPAAQSSQPPDANHVSRSTLRLALPRREYLCDDGVRVSFLVEASALRLTLKNRVYILKEVSSTIGKQYSDGSLAWWETGNEALLEEEGDHPKLLAKDCHLVSSYPPSPPLGVSIVTGTVSYSGADLVPDRAVLDVQIRDASVPDTPEAIINKIEKPIGEHEIPIPFTILLDPVYIDSKHRYVLEARIRANGRVLFRTEELYPVVTQGHPAKVDMVLRAVQATASPKP